MKIFKNTLFFALIVTLSASPAKRAFDGNPEGEPSAQRQRTDNQATTESEKQLQQIIKIASVNPATGELDEAIEIPLNALNHSITLKNMLEDLGNNPNDTIPVHNIPPILLPNIVACLKLIAEHSVNPGVVSKKIDAYLVDHCSAFQHLVSIINAANYLDVKPLLETSIAMFARGCWNGPFEALKALRFINQDLHKLILEQIKSIAYMNSLARDLIIIAQKSKNVVILSPTHLDHGHIPVTFACVSPVANMINLYCINYATNFDKHPFRYMDIGKELGSNNDIIAITLDENRGVLSVISKNGKCAHYKIIRGFYGKGYNFTATHYYCTSLLGTTLDYTTFGLFSRFVCMYKSFFPTIKPWTPIKLYEEIENLSLKQLLVAHMYSNSSLQQSSSNLHDPEVLDIFETLPPEIKEILKNA